jgi:hypothetical protein
VAHEVQYLLIIIWSFQCLAVKKENVIKWLPTRGKKDFARIVIKKEIVNFFIRKKKAFIRMEKRFFFCPKEH